LKISNISYLNFRNLENTSVELSDKINVFTEDGSKNILEGVNNDIGVAYAK